MRSLDFVLLATTVALTGLVLAVNFQGVDAGQPGALCPYLGILPALIPCDSDCQQQHYCAGGVCDDNYNCICSGDGVPASTCAYNFALIGEVPLICQCGSNASSVLIAGYNTVCNTDCQCNHGAANGTCDWDVGQCICDWPPGFEYTDNRAVCVAYGPINLAVCLIGLALNGTLPDGC